MWQTLCSLVRGLYRKMQGDYGFDFINILIGFDAAEEQMQLLLNHCSNFLTGKSPTLSFTLMSSIHHLMYHRRKFYIVI